MNVRSGLDEMWLVIFLEFEFTIVIINLLLFHVLG